jgi:hypothetical protein
MDPQHCFKARQKENNYIFHLFFTAALFGLFFSQLKHTILASAADPGCLSRIPDPDFYPSRISDPGSKNSSKREGWKIFFSHTFLCSHKFHKNKNYFSFEVLKKKIWANFQRNFLPKKLSLSSQKYGLGIRDPRSGIRK